MGCILNALHDVPNGAKVLDLPSGTGRLFPELSARGFEGDRGRFLSAHG